MSRRNKFGSVTVFGVLLSFAYPAAADLIEASLFSSDDELITVDTLRVFRWLDLTASINLSFDDVENGKILPIWVMRAGPNFA